jgi:phosphoglycolate phosphatase
VVEAMEYVLKKYGKEAWNNTKKKYRDPQKSLKDNFPNFFGDEYMKAYNEYMEYYVKYAQYKVIPMEYAEDFLQFCNKHKIDLYIVSNKEKSLLLKEVELCFPEICFKNILGNGDAVENKPSPEPVWEALRDVKYKINSDNVWLIGDSKQDTECAYNAKIQPVLIGKGKFMNNEYIKEKAKVSVPLMVFADFREIINYMQNKHIQK